MTLSRRGLSPAALVLLLIPAIVAGGLEIRPAPAGGCSISTDDHAPDPQSREASPDESAEDGEGESAKHVALGSTVTIDHPAPRAGMLRDRPARLTAGTLCGTAPIRGPPSQA